VVSSAGGRKGFVYRSRHKAYRGIKKSVGGNKTKAAKIANAGRTHAARVRMARKAARTRRARAGH